jgi:hypothetical protein
LCRRLTTRRVDGVEHLMQPQPAVSAPALFKRRKNNSLCVYVLVGLISRGMVESQRPIRGKPRRGMDVWLCAPRPTPSAHHHTSGLTHASTVHLRFRSTNKLLTDKALVQHQKAIVYRCGMRMRAPGQIRLLGSAVQGPRCFSAGVWSVSIRCAVHGVGWEVVVYSVGRRRLG